MTPDHLTKYKSKGLAGDFEIPIFQLFSELGKIWKYSLSYFEKFAISFLIWKET